MRLFHYSAGDVARSLNGNTAHHVSPTLSASHRGRRPNVLGSSTLHNRAPSQYRLPSLSGNQFVLSRTPSLASSLNRSLNGLNRSHDGLGRIRSDLAQSTAGRPRDLGVPEKLLDLFDTCVLDAQQFSASTPKQSPEVADISSASINDYGYERSCISNATLTDMTMQTQITESSSRRSHHHSYDESRGLANTEKYGFYIVGLLLKATLVRGKEYPPTFPPEVKRTDALYVSRTIMSYSPPANLLFPPYPQKYERWVSMGILNRSRFIRLTGSDACYRCRALEDKGYVSHKCGPIAGCWVQVPENYIHGKDPIIVTGGCAQCRSVGTGWKCDAGKGAVGTTSLSVGTGSSTTATHAHTQSSRRNVNSNSSQSLAPVKPVAPLAVISVVERAAMAYFDSQTDATYLVCIAVVRLMDTYTLPSGSETCLEVILQAIAHFEQSQ
jgi:hypothetical protein